MRSWEIPLPPSSNNAFPGRAGGGRRRSDEAKAWETEALLLVGRHQPFSRPVAIKGECWFPRWAGDVSNRGKLAEDLLVKAGVLVDDSIAHVRSVTWECRGVDADRPRMVLTVWELWESAEDELERKHQAELRHPPPLPTRKTIAGLARPSVYREKP